MNQARELITFTKNLYYLTKMGANLTDIFNNIKKDISNHQLKEALSDLQEKVEKGESLSKAMMGHKSIFPPDYVKMIEVAEESETLPQVLYELSLYLEAVEFARKNMRSAAFYPGLIFNIAFIFIFFIYYFASKVIFTDYTNFIYGLGQNLTPVPSFFIETARFIFSPLFLVLMFGGLIYIDTILFTNSVKGTSFFLKMPFLGGIFRKAYMIRIARSLGFMLTQGITMDNALKLIGKTGESPFVNKILLTAADKVSRGISLSKALEESKIFDSMFIFMISHGEKTENLPSSLLDGADYFEDEIKTFYSGMLKFAEPAFIITVGIIVGFIVVSVFMPFYSLTGAIK